MHTPPPRRPSPAPLPGSTLLGLVRLLLLGLAGWPALAAPTPFPATNNPALPSAATALPADHAIRMARGLDRFTQEVRTILTDRCLKCHGGEKTKGGLSLVTREELLAGGENGPVLTPFDPASSRLLKLIRHTEEPFMPPKQDPLAAADLARLTSWVEDGAPYDRPLLDNRPRSRDRSIVSTEDRKWWSFQPLARLPLPRTTDRRAASHPVDSFIAAQAAPKGITLGPAADRATLLRRASLDLLGLPPAPAELEAFLRDSSPEAWARQIDRLLDSPHYGERWARHWLDVARFAESSGFEHDYDREGAFHYRDFVIRALNSDLPYDEFLRWQLAGDEFAPENPLALMATGFLGAGVFPTQITANEVERTRYDALDDMLSTTAQAFLGLSVGCARCHDHKFDPIPSVDYYRMLSTFTTTVRSVVDLDIDPEATRARLRTWDTAREPLVRELERYEAGLKPAFDQWLNLGASLPQTPAWTLLELTDLRSEAGATFVKLEDGSHRVEGKNGDEDLYTLAGRPSLGRITGLKLEALADPAMKKSGPGRADNGNIGLSKIRLFALPVSGGATQELRLARAVADFEQNKDHLSVASALDDDPHTGWAIDPAFGKNHAAVFTLASPLEPAQDQRLIVQLQFKVNTRHNIGRPKLSITSAPEPALEGETLAPAIASLLGLAANPATRFALTPPERETLFTWWKGRDSGWRERSATLAAQAATKPDGRTKVLICGEGRPALRMHTQGADFFEQTHYLKRGSTDLKNGVAPAGFLQVLMPAPDAAARWQWQPPAGARYSGRRRALANWMTDTRDGAGALAARVAVNRLWQHHFGDGLVATPNDFGHTGTAPTHPELLDWLAGELVRNGWRLKPLHRLLMTSATYQQSSALDRAKETVDPSNQLFARRRPRRLEGEAVRDSILAVSGRLDPALYGKGTRDERSRRRSIYFTIKRSQLIGSMVAFDQPEPLASQGLRPVTTVAPQALLLLNGPQVRDAADGFARRVREEAGPASDDTARIQRAYLLALGRPPRRSELNDALRFLETQSASYAGEKQPDPSLPALADFCQVLFGLNEFAYEN